MNLVPQNPPAGVLTAFVDNGLDGSSLPGILAFVCDPESHGIVSEWLAMQETPSRVGSGGIAGAIEYLGSSPLAPVLIVDLADSPDPMADMDLLAEVCEPGITVIALGAENDVTLYRELLDAGVSDYLVKPVDVEVLRRAIERAQQQAEETRSGDRHGGLYFFSGVRGGVGASTLAINTAWQLAEKKERRCVLVDLDLQFGISSLSLDLEPGRGLREMLDNPSRIDNLFVASAATSAAANLYVLGAEETLGGDPDFSAEALELLLTELRRTYDCVIVDLPRGMVSRHGGALSEATGVMIVSDLSIAGVRDTLRLHDFVRGVAPGASRTVIANRAGLDKKNEVPKAEFERGAETAIAYLVAEDPKSVHAAQNAGKPVISIARNCKLVQTVDSICDDIVVQLDVDPDAIGEDGGAAGKKKSGGWSLWGKKT